MSHEEHVVLTYKAHIIDLIPPDAFNPNYCLAAIGTGVGRGNIFTKVDLGEGRVAFHSLLEWAPGEYGWWEADHDVRGPDAPPGPGVVGGPSGQIQLVGRAEPGPTGVFREIWLSDDTVALETYRGLYLTAENDGQRLALTINRSVIGEWQKFRYVQPPSEMLPPPPPSPAEQVMGDVSDADARRRPLGLPKDVRGPVQDAQKAPHPMPSLRDKLARPIDE